MFNLHDNPIEYVQTKRKKLEFYLMIYKATSVSLSVLIFLCTLFTGIFTPLIISKQIYSDYPTWFLFATAGTSAVTAFATSLLNFYVIKDSIKLIDKNIKLIDKEWFLHKYKVTPKYQTDNSDFLLYLRVAKILESKAAKKELSNG